MMFLSSLSTVLLLHGFLLSQGSSVISETHFPIGRAFTKTSATSNNDKSSKSKNDKKSCYEGAYTVQSPPFNACAGFRDCEPGHYCSDGVRRPCPPRTYGNTSLLTDSSCSGVCPAGFFCPTGTISPFSNPCGDATVYCPEGSHTPIEVPTGYYSVNDMNNADSDLLDDRHIKTRSAILPCPFGTFCLDGIKYACPAGHYGNELTQSNPTCNGPCPEGFYCPSASVDPFANPCAADPTIYCPKGTDFPLSVGLGYYTIMSEKSFQFGGGYTDMRPCTRGNYCQNGVQYLCPAGRFGRISQEVNSSCSGICRAGYYCPAGSYMSSQFLCDDTSVYCPTGSYKPTPVSIGHYTVGHVGNGSLEEVLVIDQRSLHTIERSAQTLCEPGYYCLPDGIKRMCPPGRYGATYGLSSKDCTGYCQPGYYCPEGSSNPTPFECGSPDVFCPPGSATPQSVDVGYYTRKCCFFSSIMGSLIIIILILVGGPSNRTYYDQRKCEPGSYCQAGIKRLCISGYYGDKFGQVKQTNALRCICFHSCNFLHCLD
jgi:hypothetical protein